MIIRFNICTTVSKEDDRKLKRFFFPYKVFTCFIFLQFCTVFLCHCGVGKQSPFINYMKIEKNTLDVFHDNINGGG